MDGRSVVALATLALLTPALAGCIDAPGALWDDDGEATALQHRDAADAAASSWAPGAVLVSIFSLESANDNDPIPVDPTPGNGESPVWFYAYRSPEGEPRAFRVLADGTVLSENETYGAEAYSDQGTALGELALDSDDAIQVAAADATFAPVLAGEGLTVAEGVARWEGRDGWYFAAMSSAGSALAVVDAATGELVSVDEFDLDFGMDYGDFAQNGFAYGSGEPLHLEANGKLSRAQAEVEHPFEFTGLPGSMATLDLSIVKELGTESVSWRIVDEEDEVVERGRLSGPPAGKSAEGAWDFELAPGDYTLVVASNGLTMLAGSVVYELTLHAGDVAAEAPTGE